MVLEKVIWVRRQSNKVTGFSNTYCNSAFCCFVRGISLSRSKGTSTYAIYYVGKLQGPDACRRASGKDNESDEEKNGFELEGSECVNEWMNANE